MRSRRAIHGSRKMVPDPSRAMTPMGTTPPPSASAPQTPDRLFKPGFRNQAGDASALVFKVGRRDARAQMEAGQWEGFGIGQRRLERERDGAHGQPFDHERAIGTRYAGFFAERAEDVLFAAERLRLRNGDDEKIARRQRIDYRRFAGELAWLKTAVALNLAGGEEALQRSRFVDQLLNVDRRLFRQQQRAALRVDREARADVESVAAAERDIVSVSHARAPRLIRLPDQLAQVFLLGLQIAGAQELAVEIIQPRQRSARWNDDHAVLLAHQR